MSWSYCDSPHFTEEETGREKSALTIAQEVSARVSTLTPVGQHRVLPLVLTWCYGMVFTPTEGGTP